MKKMMISGIILGSFFWAVFACGAEYSHRLKNIDMSFAWRIEGQRLHVELAADTEGWLGIGFNPSHKMKGANFILGYVHDNGLVLSDEYGNLSVRHVPDGARGGTVDVRSEGGSSVNGHTIIRFSLPMNSRDAADAEIIAGADTIVLLGYGEKRRDLKSQHSYRATYKVNLTTGKHQKIR